MKDNDEEKVGFRHSRSELTFRGNQEENKEMEQESYESSDKSEEKKTEESKPGIFSNLSYSWITNIIELANKGKLFYENVINIDSADNLVKVIYF